MGINMMVNGNKIKKMDKVFLHGVMVKNTQVNLKMTLEMGLVYINGTMEFSIILKF